MADPQPSDDSLNAAGGASVGKARGRPSKRGARREALLEGAAGVFNARGIAATSLGEIAEALGLSRASVYYYVNDKAELVFQCYQRACDLAAEDLAAAAEAGCGLERLLGFVRLALSPERAPTAVLSEINYLQPPQAVIVQVAHRRNVDALIGFIAAGMEDGSIRPCDAEVVAQSIIGLLAWSLMSPAWVRGRDGRAYRTRMSRAMIALLEDGIAADPRGRFECAIDAESFGPGRFNAFDRREASEAKVDQLLVAASRLFNRDGIEATSLDAVTESLGATKGVLYHYLRDKADLVLRCYERAFDLYERFAATAESQGIGGLDQALIGSHLNVQAQAGSLSPLMPQPGLDALPLEGREALVARAHGLHHLFIRLLRRGVADGSARDCDASAVAQMAAGAFAWLPKWLPPGDPRSPRRLADEICTLYFKGLRAR